MKCGILTFHRAQNYGAILQAYALQTTLEKLGAESEVIDYRCQFIENYYKPISFENIPSARKIASIFLRNGRIKDNRSGFDTFINNHLKTSETIYKSKDQLKESVDKYDMFFTGSDQVWSYITAGFDRAYFLDFVNAPKKKSSYAASFGVEKIPDEYKAEYINLISDFSHISVREEQGAHIINELLNIKPQVVLDPTLLLNRDDWSQISSSNKEKEEYLLVYLMAETKGILTLAKQLAKKKNLKIIYLNDRIFKRRGMQNRSRTSVNDWISLFLNASCVVTNSFHGLAFSINFEKEFYVQYLPAPAKVNSRLENALNIFRLRERLVESSVAFSEKEVDYTVIREILNVERTKSIKYLENIVL